MVSVKPRANFYRDATSSSHCPAFPLELRQQVNQRTPLEFAFYTDIRHISLTQLVLQDGDHPKLPPPAHPPAQVPPPYPNHDPHPRERLHLQPPAYPHPRSLLRPTRPVPCVRPPTYNDAGPPPRRTGTVCFLRDMSAAGGDLG